MAKEKYPRVVWFHESQTNKKTKYRMILVDEDVFIVEKLAGLNSMNVEHWEFVSSDQVPSILVAEFGRTILALEDERSRE